MRERAHQISRPYMCVANFSLSINAEPIPSAVIHYVRNFAWIIDMFFSTRYNLCQLFREFPEHVLCVTVIICSEYAGELVIEFYLLFQIQFGFD